jgi:hypothetical protein
MFRSIGLAACFLLVALIGVAYASRPAGLYVLVEEVELGPQGRDPEWIKIRGVFMNEPASDETQKASTYGPIRGWVNFKLPGSKRDLARLEWKDFAGATGKVVAFGSKNATIMRSGGVKRFVKPKAAQATPVFYPVEHGMYLIRDDSKPAIDLRAFQVRNPAPK